MGGDIANLPDIVTLAKKYGARVMVDDAHALGVIGEGGRGSANYFGSDEIDVTMARFRNRWQASAVLWRRTRPSSIT